MQDFSNEKNRNDIYENNNLNEVANRFLRSLDESYDQIPEYYHAEGHWFIHKSVDNYHLEDHVPNTTGHAPYVGIGRRFNHIANLLYRLAVSGIEPTDFAIATAKFYGLQREGIGTTVWLVEYLWKCSLRRNEVVRILKLL